MNRVLHLRALGGRRLHSQCPCRRVKRFERTQIHLDATQNAVKIDVTLEVGGVTESVTVEGSTPLVATQNTELGVVIGQEQVRNLPFERA